MSDNTPQPARTRSRAGIPEDQRKALRAWCRSQESRPTHAASVAWFQRTFGRRLPQSTVSVILSSKYEYLDRGPATGSFRQQPPQWPILEARLSEWLKRARETGELSTGDAIFNKAREIWPQITEYANRPPPAFSHGWLANFRKRFEASLSKGQQDGVLPAPPRNQRKELQALRTLAGEFKEENVYNVDETGLLWRKAPFDTLPSGPDEPKKDRAHICLIVCTNATGSDRIPLWVIGHKEMPVALRGVNLTALDCKWRHNPQAWVDVQIMSEWLTMFYQHVGSRRVILLLDDKPAHQAALETTPPPGNVHIQYFPEKSPNVYQPLRLGVTEQLKTHYRKQWLEYMATSFHSGSSPMEMISLYDTICWITKIWRHDVANATIYKAFRKSHLVQPQADYLTAPKPPDLTKLYEKVIRYNQSGISTRSLEEWLNPAEEEFAGTTDEELRRNPNADTSILDESVNPLSPYELIPAPADAIAGIQTAIHYMLNQPTTTANDILYLETMEKMLDRKVRNECLQQQHQTPDTTPAQLSAQAAAQVSALLPAGSSIQSSPQAPAQQSSVPSSQFPAQPYSQSYRPHVRPATRAHLPTGQRPLPPLAKQAAQQALQTPTQQPVGTYMQYQFPNQNPSFQPSQAGIRAVGMVPLHNPSGTSSVASNMGPSTRLSREQTHTPSEAGSYQPSEDQFSGDDMEI